MRLVMADESGYSGDGYFAMAGYVADREMWVLFDKLWRHNLEKHGIDHFHMKDFAHYKGLFEGWEEERRKALMSDLLEVITAGPLTAIGACLRIADFKTLSLKVQERFIGPYICCFQEMVFGSGLEVSDALPGERIDFLYSRQDDFKSKMRSIWAYKKKNTSYGERLGSLTFRDMREVPGLQAADLLVYEFRHYYHLKATKPYLAMRYPYRRLLEHQDQRHTHRLKYLPMWYLLLQASRAYTEGMKIIAETPMFDDLYQQMNPGFPDHKRTKWMLDYVDSFFPGRP